MSKRAVYRPFLALLAFTLATTPTFPQGENSPDTLTPTLQNSAWPKFRGGSADMAQAGNYGATGQVRWLFNAGEPIFSSPVVALGTSLHGDGIIFFGDLDGTFHAIDEASGEQKWSIKRPYSIYSSPLVTSDGTVYFGDAGGTLVAVDGATGFYKWQLNLGSPILSSPALDPEGNIYVNTDSVTEIVSPNGQVFNPVTVSGKAVGGTLSSVAVAGNGIGAMGTAGGQLVAFQTPSGTSMWTYQTGGPIDSSPAFGPGNAVFVGSGDGSVYAINTNGAKVWSFATHGPVYSSPAIGTGGALYIGSEDGNVYALKASTGALLWTFATGDSVFSSPAVASDGTVYVGSNDGNIYAVDGATGGLLWAETTNGEVASSPAIGPDGTVYAGSYDGNLYAIEGQSFKSYFLTLNSITGGQSLRGVVQMANPAGPGGDVMTVRSSNPFLTVPSTITIPSGSTGVSFSITSVPVSNEQGGPVTVVFGSGSIGINLIVNPYAMKNFYVSPSSVAPGSTAHGVIQLAGPAGPTGNVFNMAAPAGTTAPSTITVPPGKTGVSFPIQISNTLAQGTELIFTVEFGPLSQTSSYTVSVGP